MEGVVTMNKELMKKEISKYLGVKYGVRLEEAEAFLEDSFAVLADTIQDVRDYLEDMGLDMDGMSDEELADAAEVFEMPDGKFLIVEG